MRSNKFFWVIIILLNFSISNVLKAEQILSDQQINKIVEDLLVKENDIPNTNIDVTTKDQIVNLKGYVDTRLQANRIIELASEIKDVKDVNTDQLEIKSSKEFLSDAFITAKVKGKIRYLSMSGQIQPQYKLHVETTNKVVHIFGEVEDDCDITTIKSSIQDIIDVQDVKVNIKQCQKS